MTAMTACCRIADADQLVRRVILDFVDRTLGSSVLVCRWSRVLGQLNDSAATGGRPSL